MGRELIIDTGAIVALLDRSEGRHADCVRVLEEHAGQVVSTEPVLTEALHLLSFDDRAQSACLQLFLRGAVALVPAGLRSLERAGRLMAKYRDVPMDYADATLVVLAEELETDRIFTLDNRGFTVYRWKKNRPFRIAP